MSAVEPETELAAAETVVYLVDDDRGMVSSISQWLSLSGLRVRAFADPVALMKVVKHGVKCVVISDIRMPGIDGMELLKLIKGRDRRIPVILITGHGDIPLAVEAIKSGAHEFLSKPFSPEKLLEVVKSAQMLWSGELAGIGQEASVQESSTDVESQNDPVQLKTYGDLTAQIDEYESNLIRGSLERHKGAISKVIEELNIPRRTLNAKMKKHGIERSKYR